MSEVHKLLDLFNNECPELRQLGIHTVILKKGQRY